MTNKEKIHEALAKTLDLDEWIAYCLDLDYALEVLSTLDAPFHILNSLIESFEKGLNRIQVLSESYDRDRKQQRIRVAALRRYV